MRDKGAKDVPNPWSRHPNLRQMFSAVYGQGKTKTMGITSFRDEIRTVSMESDGENSKCHGKTCKGQRVRNMPERHSGEWGSRVRRGRHSTAK